MQNFYHRGVSITLKKNKAKKVTAIQVETRATENKIYLEPLNK